MNTANLEGSGDDASGRDIVNKPESFDIVMYVLSPEGQSFGGYDLVQMMMSQNLVYGPMSIYHRYENLDGTGNKLFSVASADKQGTFDLNQIGNFSCTGVAFFMTVDDQNIDHINSYKIMIKTIESFITGLGGQLVDRKKNPIRQSEIEHWFNQIKNFNKSKQHFNLFEEI